MAKARIRARAGRRGAARRWRTDQVLVNARRLAFAIIVEGAHPEQVMNIMSWCGLRVCSRQAVYNAMRPICQDICRLARTLMNEAIESYVAARGPEVAQQLENSTNPEIATQGQILKGVVPHNCLSEKVEEYFK